MRESGRIVWSATVPASVLVPPHPHPPPPLSYHAVQGRGGELGVHVGEAFELALVDVGDDQLVRGRQHGLRAREELVEVLCSFATLQESFRGVRQQGKTQTLVVARLLFLGLQEQQGVTGSGC